MATLTLNAKTDLTYEEIYDGYANGKSRLPKILKEIAENTQTTTALSILAGTTGINVIRRRTGGGNSTDVSGIGLTSSSSPVAVLLSAARYNVLKSAYDFSSSGGLPSENFIDADVRGVTKNPFDLIDFVSGINNSDLSEGSGGAASTRAAKLQDQGSNSVIRDITTVITAGNQDFDVRALFGDRVGVEGATGTVNGIDQGIAGLIATDGEAVLIGNTGATFNMATDTDMQLRLDGGATGATAEYASEILTIDQVVAETNAQVAQDADGLPVAHIRGSQIAVRSQTLGGSIVATEENTALGITGTSTGATVGSAGLTGEETIIELDAATVGRLTNIRYGTFQFGTLRVFTSINDVAPVAFFVHPDLLSDLEANQP